jgi:hypothetical protein
MKNYLITFQNNGIKNQIILSEYAETLARLSLLKILKKQNNIKNFGITNVKEVIAQDFDEYYNVY